MLFNVEDDPTYSHLQEVDSSVKILAFATGIFIVLYFIAYVALMFYSLAQFKGLSFHNKSMFIVNTLMMIFCIITVSVGVYSRYFMNGGAFMFFFALFNLYVYVVMYLNMPADYSSDLSINEQVEMQSRFSVGGPQIAGQHIGGEEFEEEKDSADPKQVQVEF